MLNVGGVCDLIDIKVSILSNIMDSSPSPGKSSGDKKAATGESSSSPSNTFDFQKSVSNRLNAMTDRQDSIQALSLWMIHHKTDCQKIAACWLAAMKRGRPKLNVLSFLHFLFLL